MRSREAHFCKSLVAFRNTLKNFASIIRKCISYSMDVTFESFQAPQLAAKRSTKQKVGTEQVGYRGKIPGIPDPVVKSLDKAWNTHFLSYLM